MTPTEEVDLLEHFEEWKRLTRFEADNPDLSIEAFMRRRYEKRTLEGVDLVYEYLQSIVWTQAADATPPGDVVAERVADLLGMSPVARPIP